MIKTMMFRIEGTENEFVKVQFDYALGGENMLTYKVDRRGYYAYVRRVKRERGFESFMLHDGRKFLLKEVKRQSKRAEVEAEAKFNEVYMDLIRRTYPNLVLSTGCTIR